VLGNFATSSAHNLSPKPSVGHPLCERTRRYYCRNTWRTRMVMRAATLRRGCRRVRAWTMCFRVPLPRSAGQSRKSHGWNRPTATIRRCLRCLASVVSTQCGVLRAECFLRLACNIGQPMASRHFAIGRLSASLSRIAGSTGNMTSATPSGTQLQPSRSTGGVITPADAPILGPRLTHARRTGPGDCPVWAWRDHPESRSS
jgi:hypothetical protein